MSLQFASCVVLRRGRGPGGSCYSGFMSNRQADAAVRWLADQRDAMEAATRELVEINSFTDNVEGGRRVGALLRDSTFAIEGVRLEVFPSTRFADHMAFSTTSEQSGAGPVALIGHLDTV